MKRTINNLSHLLVILALILWVVACSHPKNSPSVHFNRFEHELWNTPSDQLQQHLIEVQNLYNTPLLNLQPLDPQFMEMLSGFVLDPVMRDIYQITDSAFQNMEPIEKQLEKPLSKMLELLPSMHIDHFYTMVTGQFDYPHRVFCDDASLVISLDQYALPYMERFSYFGTPMYLVALSHPQYMVPDILATMARQKTAFCQDEGQVTLLDYIVAEGKVMFLLEQLLPDTPDSLLLRYSDEQLQWMKNNEAQVWSYFIKNKLLYETDYMRYHNFVDEAPKTNAFRDSAPRTTSYIGWNIVKNYMKKNKQVSLAELFDNPNAQEILSKSGYRP